MDMKVKYRSEHCLDVCRSLWSLKQSGQLCDIFFNAGDEVIFAHRSVLAASSPFFCKQDSDPDNAETALKIHVVETTSKVVNEVVRYLYTGFIVLNKDNIDEVESLCKKWQVESALNLCEKFKENSEHLKKDNEKFKKDKKKARKGSTPVNNGSRIKSNKRVRPTEVGEDSQREIPAKIPRVESDSISSITPTGDSCEVENILLDTLTDTTTPLGSVTAVNTVGRETPQSPENGHCLKKMKTPLKKPRMVQSTDGLTTQSNGSNPSAEVIDKIGLQEDGVAHRASPSAASAPRPQSTRGGQGGGKNPMECGHCLKLLPSAEALAKHKLKCKACPKCKKVFKTSKKCINHILANSCTNLSMETFNCDKCRKTFPTEATRESHIKKRHQTEQTTEANSCKKLSVETFRCDECGRAFSTALYRDTHIRKSHQTVQTTEKSIQLQICKVEGCNYQTRLPKNLNKHLKYTHSKNQQVICDTCGAVSKNEYYLKIHQRARHTDALSCEVCGLRVKTRAVLKSHKMRQHGEGTPEYVCAQCTYVTYTKTELDKHMFHKHKVPLPSGNEGYTCPHCQWQCIQKTSMDQHILRHTAKERNFSCQVCNKRFITSTDLKGHMVSHDPERKKFKCPHCDYCTAYGAYKLRDHVSRIHENKDYKPWACELCSYRTNVKGNLTSHLRKMHKLNVETQQRLIHKVEPFNAAHADLKTPGGGGGGGGIKGGCKQEAPAEGGAGQVQEDTQVQPVIVAPLSDPTPGINQVAGSEGGVPPGASGYDQVFCVTPGLVTVPGSTVDPGGGGGREGGPLHPTTRCSPSLLDAATRTEHAPLSMLNGPYIGHPGQQLAQLQPHPHYHSLPQSQLHEHTLSQPSSQPHLMAQTPLPINIAPIKTQPGD